MIGKILLPLLFLALVLGGPARAASKDAPSSKDAAAAKEDLRQLRERIESVQKNITSAEESKNEAADALSASERAISDANRALGELTAQSRAANLRLGQLKDESARAQRELKIEQAALSNMLYQQYAAGRPATLAVLLSGADANAVARNLYYLTYVARARAELIGRARANASRIAELTEEARRQAVELATVTQEQGRQQARLEREKKARAQVLARISREIQQQRRTMGTLKRDETRLTNLIDQLAKVLARTSKPRPLRETRAEPRVRNERVPDREQTGPFAQLRGKLALPVRGELANRFGSPRQDGGLTWKGLFITAAPGEEVRAVAGGRVVFADWLRGFGNLLIIDHGDGYMSLYGYNETLFKRVGDTIRGGERIAAVGNTGGHPDSGLYFEMRHEGRPFDPLSWVSMR